MARIDRCAGDAQMAATCSATTTTSLVGTARSAVPDEMPDEMDEDITAASLRDERECACPCKRRKWQNRVMAPWRRSGGPLWRRHNDAGHSVLFWRQFNNVAAVGLSRPYGAALNFVASGRQLAGAMTRVWGGWLVCLVVLSAQLAAKDEGPLMLPKGARIGVVALLRP